MPRTCTASQHRNRRHCCCRLDTASNQLGAASASQASALLGVLIQHECSKASETSRSNPKRHQGEAALCALGRQSRCLAADAPRVVQQHVLATAARVTPMERNTLPASSIHGVQPASQQAATPASSSNHASCSAPEYNSLPLQQPRHMASDMQQSCSGVFPACDRAAAQHAQLKHQAPQTSGMQSLPRPQNQQNRQHQRQGRLREHCDRGPLQQRPGAAHHRQPSKRRRPQALLLRHRVGTVNLETSIPPQLQHMHCLRLTSLHACTTI